MKTILLTNDDGYFSEGIVFLKEFLSKKYNVFVVAPDRERSAISMALTLNRPLRLTQIESEIFSVNGTPADCVNLAVQKVMPIRPDFIISGMNLGENLSEDIFFSGTVGGAFSGYLYNIPSMAVSLISDKKSYSKGSFDFKRGAEVTEKILERLLGFGNSKVVYNVNIPFNNNEKIIVTSTGFKRYNPDIIEDIDPRGQKYYWIGTGNPTYGGGEGSDVWAIQNGYISLSVLKFDLNSLDDVEKLSNAFDQI